MERIPYITVLLHFNVSAKIPGTQLMLIDASWSGLHDNTLYAVGIHISNHKK